jgi:uroporphyrinogen III methyltransferase/synthase
LSARAGVVYLVGAGPGDPGLITVRGLELVATVDLILHDRLVPGEILAAARPQAELIYVGKRPGEAAIEQAEIERRMVEAASAGRSVVRLKGGDPFVFGRGGEEGEALAAAGIPFEVVPGVTAGVAAPAYAGIPVTHRDDASAVAFVTGHEDPGKESSTLDWQVLADFPGTLVLYMGVKRLAENASALIAAGREADEPAAVIERGTTPRQRTVTATLGTLAEAVERQGIEAPAVVVVGAVAARRQALAWLERRPLFGLRIVVTRARAQASELASRLRGLGGEIIELPAIRIDPLIDSAEVHRAINDLHAYALVCLTSPNGARLLFEAMAEAGLDARALANASVAAIGPGTAAELSAHGIRADVVPDESVAEAMVEALAEVPIQGRPALVARAAEARDVLPDALRERGAKVDVVALYETVAETPNDEAVASAQAADYLTFTSSSTVRNLVAALDGRLPEDIRVVSIGPITSRAAREAGLQVDVEAERHDIDGLVDALLADAGRSAAGRRA